MEYMILFRGIVLSGPESEYILLHLADIQWNLRIMDMFETHCIRTIGKSPFGTVNLFLCSEVIPIYQRYSHLEYLFFIQYASNGANFVIITGPNMVSFPSENINLLFYTHS